MSSTAADRTCPEGIDRNGCAMQQGRARHAMSPLIRRLRKRPQKSTTPAGQPTAYQSPGQDAGKPFAQLTLYALALSPPYGHPALRFQVRVVQRAPVLRVLLARASLARRRQSVSILPKRLEPLRRQLGAANRVLNIFYVQDNAARRACPDRRWPAYAELSRQRCSAAFTAGYFRPYPSVREIR